MKRYIIAVPFLYALISLAGCAAFTPDQYVGDGVWSKGPVRYQNTLVAN